jgi:hypothetical protein
MSQAQREKSDMVKPKMLTDAGTALVVVNFSLSGS